MAGGDDFACPECGCDWCEFEGPAGDGCLCDVESCLGCEGFDCPGAD